jgi:hypothetical protein
MANVNTIFSSDIVPENPLVETEGRPIADVARTITSEVSEEAVKKGDAFANCRRTSYFRDIFLYSDSA